MPTIINNKEKSRFEITSVNEPAVLDYSWDGNAMVLVHTYVSESLRGQGLADALAKFALDYIRENHLKAIVKCPFVASFLERHAEYNDLVIAKIVSKK